MKKLLFALALSAFTMASALAAQVPYVTGPIDPGAMQLTLNQIIQSINSGIGGSGYTFGRNLLDNGDMWVDQRGTSAATCATTSGLVETSYSADRWGCDVDFTNEGGK